MTATQPAHLDCAHCGDVAIESADGFFADGEGGACMTCGFPGGVSCDSETEPYWNESDDPEARCTAPDCLDCNGDSE